MKLFHIGGINFSAALLPCSFTAKVSKVFHNFSAALHPCGFAAKFSKVFHNFSLQLLPGGFTAKVSNSRIRDSKLPNFASILMIRCLYLVFIFFCLQIIVEKFSMKSTYDKNSMTLCGSLIK